MSPDYENEARSYLDDVSRAIYEVCEEQVDRLAALLVTATFDGRLILAAGNGGSLATLVHLATDLEKCVAAAVRSHHAGPGLVPRVHVLGMNGSVLSAWSNDESWENALRRQVEVWGAPGDVLLVLSASGTSVNLLHAAAAARQRGMTVAALVGRKGSPLADLAHFRIEVGTEDVQVAEDVHSVVSHSTFREVRRLILERTGG